MAFSLPNARPDSLPEAMEACWKDGSDQIFEAFFGLFKQFMQVDLAQYTHKLALVEQVCAASREEIRREFSHQQEKNFDYILLFRAIVYSHFSHVAGDHGVNKMLQKAQSPLQVASSGAAHDISIAVFSGLLTLDGPCRVKLLDFSLRVGAASAGDLCFALLKAQLARLKGMGPL
jgi:hypothetical protein